MLQRTPSIAQLACSNCGARADASCNCGAPYVPYIPAGKAAEAAIAKNPEKSDRAIAADLGVDHKTVSRARKATGDNSPVEQPRKRGTVSNDTVEKRIGRDGKTRKMPKPKAKKKTKLIKVPTGRSIDQVNQIVRHLQNAVMGFEERLWAWWMTKPKLEKEDHNHLIMMLNSQGERFYEIAQELDGR